MNGKVVALCIARVAGGPMLALPEVQAIARHGLEGDRYALGAGSFNKEKVGRRQVTLINAKFFLGTEFGYLDTRRNIVTDGIELMWLIGKDFPIGEARFRGLKYCEPCNRPSKKSGKFGFQETFSDCGGLVAEVIEGGLIRIGDEIISPPKGY